MASSYSKKSNKEGDRDSDLDSEHEKALCFSVTQPFLGMGHEAMMKHVCIRRS